MEVRAGSAVLASAAYHPAVAARPIRIGDGWLRLPPIMSWRGHRYLCLAAETSALAAPLEPEARRCTPRAISGTTLGEKRKQCRRDPRLCASARESDPERRAR